MQRSLTGRLVKLGVLSILCFVTPFTFQLAHSQNASQRVWQRFVSRPSRDQRPGSVGRGGANRDRCPFTRQELTALVPLAEDLRTSYLEQTSMVRPSWYFYVPYQPRIGLKTEFTLLDEDEAVVYQETFPLRHTPGIISITLPSQIPNLEVDQTYSWVFSVICTPNNRSGDAAINGVIEVVSPETLPTNLQTLTIDERLEVYAEQLLWFDFIHELASARTSESENSELEEAWNTILEGLMLEETNTSVHSIR